MLSKAVQGRDPTLGKLIVIGHGDCPEDAELLRQRVAEQFPDADIRIMEIGPVIGAHTGPRMLALLFWGSAR